MTAYTRCHNQNIKTTLMSALTVLFLVLPVLPAFIVHDAEEIAMLRKSTHKSFRATAKAYLASLLGILLVTAYVLARGPFAAELWSVLFIVVTTHLLLHVGKGIASRKYVPGLVSAILFLPYFLLGMTTICRYLLRYAG